jgi:uncharacterized protein (DUF697 family)
MTSPFDKVTSALQVVQKYSGVLGGVVEIPKRFSAFPIRPFNILEQAKSYLGMRDESLKIGLFIDPRTSDETIDLIVKLFEPANEKTRVLVHILTEELSLGEKVSYDAMVFMVHSSDRDYAVIEQSLGHELPTLLMVEEGYRQDAAYAYDMSILDVVSARKPELLVAQTSAWFADNLSEHRLALASDFTFMRPALAAATTAATAKQNAIIAAIFFLPGADLPVMTLNQIKMALQLAFIYGEELTFKRIAEITFVVLAAYGSRSAVRSLTQNQSRILSWPVKIAVAYASTLAVGKGLELWLTKGPEIPALDEPIPSVGELLAKTPLADSPLVARFLPAPEEEPVVSDVPEEEMAPEEAPAP